LFTLLVKSWAARAAIGSVSDEERCNGYSFHQLCCLPQALSLDETGAVPALIGDGRDGTRLDEQKGSWHYLSVLVAASGACMPRFFLDSSDGTQVFTDEEGLELKDLTAAKFEAQRVLPDMVREALPEESRRNYVVSVRNEQN
jgi:hypothetical protein